MVAAIKQTVTVEPGGVVRVTSPELQAGARAEVIVLVERPGDGGRGAAGGRSLTSFLGAGKGVYGSVEEIDTFIRNERDTWER
jgi:hypothetical protein